MTLALLRLSRATTLAVGLLLVGAGANLYPLLAIASETAVAPEKNPPGDIPDNQAFVAFSGPQGYLLQVPEGWARKEAPDGVAFSDKYGRVELVFSKAHGVLTVDNVRALEAASLEKSGHAVKISTITKTQLPAGPAIKITFSSNSEPNGVTGKQIRLESERFLVVHGDQLAALTFSAPMGADNVDQWTLMSKSLRWQ
ncbi:MAG: hypothetical protein KGQ46_14385 [Hyphomicrobiales bacterium]|nr:hypothetical protein [Hyphomicrobiales bacterium]MDE2115027.1 hypothetical protein [Hyphomicrobiales bacterium]